jgi:plasmid maintenance system antidote protein VapI
VTIAIRIEDVAGTDFSDVAGPHHIGPVRPGDVLCHEFMQALGLSARALARELGERFSTSAKFWLNLQMMHDLEEARDRRSRSCPRGH